MIKKGIGTFIIMTFGLLAYCQDKSVSEQIEEVFTNEKIIVSEGNLLISPTLDSLLKVVDGLSKQIEGLEQRQSSKTKNYYNKKLKLVKSELQLLDQLRQAVDAINDDRELLKSRTIITKLNSPVDTTLFKGGSSFVNIVMNNFRETVEGYLTKAADKAEVKTFAPKKKGFFSRIGNLIKTAATFFPPLEIVSKITDQIQNTSVAVTSWDGGAPSKSAKNLIVSSEYVFDEKLINTFTNKISGYITYYKKLNNSSNTFLSDLETHRIKYNSLKTNLDTVWSELDELQSLDLSITAPQSYIDQVNDLFEITATTKNSAFFKKVLSKNDINTILMKLRTAIDFVSEFNDFHEDFNIVVIKDYQNSITSLKAAKLLEKADSEKIDTQITELKNFINGTQNSAGFDKRYLSYLTKINSHLAVINNETLNL